MMLLRNLLNIEMITFEDLLYYYIFYYIYDSLLVIKKYTQIYINSGIFN